MIIPFDKANDACPCCQSTQLEGLGHTTKNLGACNPAVISGCAVCGLVFVNPPPSAAELDAYYRPGGEWDAKLVRRACRRDEKIQMRRQESQSPRPKKASYVEVGNRLREHYGARRVLDFGCGNGRMLDKYQLHGWETTGIDPITADSITKHRMLATMPTTPSFDLVLLNHVLEHIDDPLSVLRGARACLVDNGHLLIGSPTLDSLAEHRQKDYCINRTQHITAYTRRSMRNLLALAGFAVEDWLKVSVPYRMRVLARVAESPPLVPDPLQDARCNFQEFMTTEGSEDLDKAARLAEKAARLAEKKARRAAS